MARERNDLHRLTSTTATNGPWGESYSYDGFGNLTGKTPTVGSAPPFTGGANSKAAGGNLQGQWDVEKRPMTQGQTFYVYDPWGRRIWHQVNNNQYGQTTCEAYFYGVTGQKLETYNCTYGSESLNSTLEGINTYFAGKMLSEKNVYVATDRLGSVRADSNGTAMSYFPWGEERTNTADGRTKFAGYFRDMPGQDYANARYYSATSGSFWSPDPGGMKTADSGSPNSWNRFPYANGDPVNRIDPWGTEDCNADFCATASATSPPGPTPGSPAQGSGNDAPPVDLGGDQNPPGGGNSGPTPLFPWCSGKYSDQTLSFIYANYPAAEQVSSSSGVPVDWLLAWGAQESGWGTNPRVAANGTFFNETTTPSSPTGGWLGATNCPATALPGWACFSDFEDSLTAALDTKHNTWNYNGVTGISALYVIQIVLKANPNATEADVFGAIAAAGYDRHDAATYGGNIAQTNAAGRINCLVGNGYLH